MFKEPITLAVACSLAASPCIAADLGHADDSGARRTGAGLGAYFDVPLGGPRAGRAQAGLRLTVTHDYRDALAPTARVARSEALDLRMHGNRQPTLYAAGLPITGGEGQRNNLSGAGTAVTVAVVALAVVGAVVLYKAVNHSDDE